MPATSPVLLWVARREESGDPDAPDLLAAIEEPIVKIENEAGAEVSYQASAAAIFIGCCSVMIRAWMSPETAIPMELWASAALSALVDNIPYVATVSPVVAELVQAAGSSGQSKVLWWSLALGADLGGNATAIGASANVVILGLADRSGQHISFWEFTNYGVIVATATVGLATPYLWLRYFVLAS